MLPLENRDFDGVEVEVDGQQLALVALLLLLVVDLDVLVLQPSPAQDLHELLVVLRARVLKLVALVEDADQDLESEEPFGGTRESRWS